jgi:hypothetical protein
LVWACGAQLNAAGPSACQSGRLRLDSSSLAQIFIASTAELPGLLLAALVMDWAGRKWRAARPCNSLNTIFFPAAAAASGAAHKRSPAADQPAFMNVVSSDRWLLAAAA